MENDEDRPANGWSLGEFHIDLFCPPRGEFEAKSLGAGRVLAGLSPSLGKGSRMQRCPRGLSPGAASSFASLW